MTDKDEYNSRGTAKHLRIIININCLRHKKSNKCSGFTMTAEVWPDLLFAVVVFLYFSLAQGVNTNQVWGYQRTMSVCFGEGGHIGRRLWKECSQKISSLGSIGE